MAEEIPQAPMLESDSGLLIVPQGKDLIRVGILGAIVGLLIPAVAWLLQTYFINPVFCHETATLGVCAAGEMTTYYVATVIFTVVAVALLANWQIFRPLLIAVAAASALWGLQKYMGDTIKHAAWEYYLSSAVIYAAAFILFYWLLRLKNFALSVILAVIGVVIIRWVLLV